MGVDGQGSREIGGSVADRIFSMKYPMPFLQHWYTTYSPLQQDTTTNGSSVVSPSSAGADVDMTGVNTSTLTDSNFPQIPPRKTVVFNHIQVQQSLKLEHRQRSTMRFGGGQVFQKANASVVSRMVY